jgi:hypothetical protein
VQILTRLSLGDTHFVVQYDCWCTASVEKNDGDLLEHNPLLPGMQYV